MSIEALVVVTPSRVSESFRFQEWKKLQPKISAFIGLVMSGPKYDAKVRGKH